MRIYFLFIILICLPYVAQSIEPIRLLDCEKENILIGLNSEYFIEKTIIKDPIELVLSEFKPVTSKVANFNLNRNAIWLHFKIAPNKSNKTFLLDIANGLTNSIELFSVNEQGSQTKEILGDNFPFKYRKFNSVNFVFEIQNKSQIDKDFFIRVTNHEQFQLPIYIGTKENIFQSHRREGTLMIIFSTILLVMFLYNLFIFISTKDVTYLYYILYILSILITQLSMRGYGFKLLWPNNIWLQQHGTYIFSALVGLTSLVFFRTFIKRDNLSRVTNILIDVIVFAYLINVLISILKFYSIGYFFLQLLAFAAVLVAFVSAIIASRKKVASANYYLAAWILFMLGILLFVAKDYNLIPYSFLSVYSLILGSGVEVLLLSFALANRINVLQKDKDISQQQAYTIAKENEKILCEQNATLELLVNERTQKLEQTLIELKKSETELVNKEKMSSLGLLTAGIAHEINNPINFITSGINPLKRDFKDIVLIVEEIMKLNITEDPSAKILAVNNLIIEKDISYLIEEIEILLDGIEDGANRTASIVKGLQKFSRSDQGFTKEADLIDGLENTLSILRNLINDKISIKKIYEVIPFINCAIGQINQVFLNVLTNAIHAVVDNGKIEKNITLQINKVGEHDVSISISDNGIGIPQDILGKIFDPFFTTKEVGKGTGLGLAISQKIIQEHGGKLDIKSKEQVGTTVVIYLPIKK